MLIWTFSQSLVDGRPHFVVLEQVHRDVLADRDVDELLGRIDQAQDRGQVVGPALGAKSVRRRSEVNFVDGFVARVVDLERVLGVVTRWQVAGKSEIRIKVNITLKE